jgi:hypothetical protein
MRYIITKNNTILQILQKEPLFIPSTTTCLVYNGSELDESLFVEDNQIKIKEFKIQQYQHEQFELIQTRIDELRSLFASVISSQNDVYWEKTQEAIDYASLGFPEDISNYPFIAVDIELTGKTGKEVTQNILTKRKQWLNIAAQTEKIRKQAYSKIFVCETKECVDNVIQNIFLQLDSLS